jgi:hypothetical protein
VFVVLTAIAILLLGGRAAVTIRDADIADFRCFYEAGRLVRSGLDPYDRATWTLAVYTDPGRVPHCARTFVYPMPTAMAMSPISLLPEPIALGAWEIVLLGSLLGGIALLARTWPALDVRPLVLVALWSQPMFSAVANAQFGPVIFLALAALAYAASRGSRGVWLASWTTLLVKPHITFLVLATTPLLRRVGSVKGAGIVALTVAVASVLLAPRWPLEYLNELFGQQLALDEGLGTLWTISSDLGLPTIVGGIVAIVVAIVFVASIPRPIRAPENLVAVLVAASFIVTPYARPHDLIALTPCWAATLAAVGSRRVFFVGVVLVGLVLPWVITGLTLGGLPLSLYVLVPLATAGLLALALRREASG